MYAIIRTSGNQFRVKPGMIFAVDRLAGQPGDTITLDSNVLMVKTDDDLKIGAPCVSGAAVDLEIIEHYRGKKLVVFKMKRRKRCRRKHGHRQELTRVAVRDITIDGKSLVAGADGTAAEQDVPAEGAPAEEAEAAVVAAVPAPAGEDEAGDEEKPPKTEPAAKKGAAEEKEETAKPAPEAKAKKPSAKKSPAKKDAAEEKEETAKPALKAKPTKARKPSTKKSPAKGAEPQDEAGGKKPKAPRKKKPAPDKDEPEAGKDSDG